ncbi:MAG: serine/threonine protein kinase [Gammaproteobacteria bacterium]|nr:MAG: serine/threonine protein kinase [Gammaproteobacteria bacterium]
MINKTRGSDLQPFSGLTPEVVLDAAAAFGLAPDGRLFALNSYENRVYQLGAGEGQLVLKFYRPRRWTDAQIVEEHQFTAELAAAELAVAAPLAIGGETLLRYHEFRFAAFPWMRGRSPELDAPEARQILGRSVARLHQVGTVSGALLERVSEAFTAAAGVREIRLHGDCHLGNLLWNEHGPVFVDLDDCASGVRAQDLWMMLAGSPAEQQRQWGELLEGYRQFADFDFAEVRLIEPLRALRMLHHAAWVAHRWRDPAFPRAFPWAAEPRYWEGYLQDLLEQIAVIDEPPLLRQ